MMFAPPATLARDSSLLRGFLFLLLLTLSFESLLLFLFLATLRQPFVVFTKVLTSFLREHVVLDDPPKSSHIHLLDLRNVE
ncbi:MAG: hypothetical protein KBD29_02795 [Candidatus Magasanikbacteria bacterium]|nr:hypothetical protein [Candidatus Magasanikbacteria bacterium]